MHHRGQWRGCWPGGRDGSRGRSHGEAFAVTLALVRRVRALRVRGPDRERRGCVRAEAVKSNLRGRVGVVEAAPGTRRIGGGAGNRAPPHPSLGPDGRLGRPAGHRPVVRPVALDAALDARARARVCAGDRAAGRRRRGRGARGRRGRPLRFERVRAASSLRASRGPAASPTCTRTRTRRRFRSCSGECVPVGPLARGRAAKGGGCEGKERAFVVRARRSPPRAVDGGGLLVELAPPFPVLRV